jgi:hypothetical protein
MRGRQGERTAPQLPSRALGSGSGSGQWPRPAVKPAAAARAAAAPASLGPDAAPP